MAIKQVVVEYRTTKDLGTTILDPGASREFLGCPQTVFRPDELLLVGHGMMRVDSIRIADRAHSFGVPGERTEASGGIAALSLKAMPERALAIAESIYVTITNIGSTAKSVEPVLRGIAPRAPGDTERYLLSLLPLVPFIDGPPIRQFRIPSESWLKQYPEDTLPEGVYRNMGGSVVVCWHAPWRGRIAKLKIQGDDGVRLIDLAVAGCSQLLNSASLPVELFRQLQSIDCREASVAQNIAFAFSNPDHAEKTVGIELEYQTTSHPELETINAML